MIMSDLLFLQVGTFLPQNVDSSLHECLLGLLKKKKKAKINHSLGSPDASNAPSEEQKELASTGLGAKKVVATPVNAPVAVTASA